MARCGWCMSGHHGSCRDDCPCACDKTMKGTYERTLDTSFVSPAELAAHPWGFRCEVEGCYYGVCADTQEAADRLRWIHPCPRESGVKMGKSILQEAWEQLDAEVDAIYELMDEGGGVAGKIMLAKARARGKAEILALFMIPHFRTADEISTEAGKRYIARRDGTYHRTPGMSR